MYCPTMARMQISTPPVPMDLPAPQSPEYRCGGYGKWKLRAKAEQTFERGYFTGFAAEPPGHYIVKDGHIWMSTSRLERESHAIHLKQAQGNVVVCGVGMGLYLFNIAAKPQVEQVVAVDLDWAVVDLVRNATGFDSWPGRDKIRFVHRNALDLTPADIGLGQVDYLYVDIWPELGDPMALSQTQAIQSVVKARSVGWWGQEIDFIQWLFDHRSPEHLPTLTDLIDFNRTTGLPLAEESVGYLLRCRQAGVVFASYGSLPFASASRDGRSASS
jgi:hypothetical protein